MSNTDELELDLHRSICLLDTPKVQGVTGFLQQAGGKFSLRDVEIRSGNRYASVMVVSLDAEDLSRSQRVLVQVGTQSRPAGWQEEALQISLSGGQAVLPGW